MMLNLSSFFAKTPHANETIQPKSQGRTRKLLASSAFNAGRNQEKRDARRRERLMRAAHVATVTYRPKRHLSHLTVDMLANRRLRQRNGGL